MWSVYDKDHSFTLSFLVLHNTWKAPRSIQRNLSPLSWQANQTSRRKNSSNPSPGPNTRESHSPNRSRDSPLSKTVPGYMQPTRSLGTPKGGSTKTRKTTSEKKRWPVGLCFRMADTICTNNSSSAGPRGIGSLELNRTAMCDEIGRVSFYEYEYDCFFLFFFTRSIILHSSCGIRRSRVFFFFLKVLRLTLFPKFDRKNRTPNNINSQNLSAWSISSPKLVFLELISVITESKMTSFAIRATWLHMQIFVGSFLKNSSDDAETIQGNGGEKIENATVCHGCD